MSDASATPAAVPAPKKSPRAHAPINQALIDELDLAEQLAATAASPDYAGKLADEEIDAAFLANLQAQIEAADNLIGAATGKTADKKAATQREDDFKSALLAQIQKVQIRAKRKYARPADPMREKYFIGERLDSNRALLERSTRALLATLATDTLKGHKPAATAALKAALEAYVQSQTVQTGGQAGATTTRAALEAQVKAVAALRRELQYAADIAWPADDKANAGTRTAFALPPTKALR